MENTIVEEPIIEYETNYTYTDYLKFEFEEMVELIKGRIYKMSPAPRVAHQKISGNLHALFHHFFYNSACHVFHAPTDVILPIASKKRESATTVVQPDIFVVCESSIIEDAGIFGVPDLIIEILSPHTKKKDIQNKYAVYEEAGVKEYWIAMPEQKLLEVFILKEQKYQRVETYTHTDIFECITFPDLVIDLNNVFEGLKD